jgi:hypothetical protein
VTSIIFYYMDGVNELQYYENMTNKMATSIFWW